MTTMEKLRTILGISTYLIIFFLLAGCQNSEEVVVEVTPIPTPTLPPEQEVIWEVWERSQHADTADLDGETTNSYCAQCHSPTNWLYYTTMKDNIAVPEEEWGHIGCVVCHKMDGRVADADFYWYDNTTQYYEVVVSADELCRRCHTDEEPHFYYGRDMGDEVHQEMTCVDCHDPHEPYASCSDCHEEISEGRTLPSTQHINLTDRSQCLECHPDGLNTHPMETQRQGEKDCLVCHDYLANISEEDLPEVHHSRTHKDVDCVACHDGSELQVDQTEEQSEWMVFRTVELPSGEVTQPYQSHNLTLNVKCARCHHINNAWGLVDFAPGTNQ